MKKGAKSQKVEEYGTKVQQIKLYRRQEQERHVSRNLNPGKAVEIITMLEKMVATRSRKQARGLTDDGSCKICTQNSETIEHLVAPGRIK